MDENALTVGVDIGGTNTVAGLVTDDGRCVHKAAFATRDYDSAEAFARRLSAAVTALCAEAPAGTAIRGVGIAAPALNSRTGLIRNSANLSWRTADIAGMVRAHVDLPIAVANDGDAAALGEMTYGAVTGMRNFLLLTLGTGLGAGIVADGALLTGANGIAGEIGHIIVEPGGRVCGCRRRGCAETYISATGICRTVIALLADRTDDSPLRRVPVDQIAADRVYALARQGDPIASEAFAITGAHLGRLLANLAVAFDPEAFVVAGGLARAGDALLVPAREAFQASRLSLLDRAVPILGSSLPDGDAPILGAACLLRRLPTPAPTLATL